MKDIAVIEGCVQGDQWDPLAYVGPCRTGGEFAGFPRLRVRYLPQQKAPELSLEELGAHVESQLVLDRLGGAAIPRDEHSENLYHAAFTSGVLWAMRNVEVLK